MLPHKRRRIESDRTPLPPESIEADGGSDDETESAARIGIESLPDELHAAVFSLVPCAERISVLFLVCRRWKNIAGDPSSVGPPCCTDPALVDEEKRLLFEHRHNERVRTWLATCAAGAGHLRCLQRAHQLGKPWSERACTKSARGGHLECLRYLFEHGCPWDQKASFAAAASGRTDCLRYLCENGCPLHWLACDAVLEEGHLACMEYIHGRDLWDLAGNSAFWRASCYGHVHVIRFAWEHGLLTDTHDVLLPAVGERRWDILEYGLQQGWAMRPALWACFLHCVTSIDMMEWLYAAQCPWNERTCAMAASCTAGVPLLRFAHERGCPWDARTCRKAARNGVIGALEYAHQNGCPWNAETCEAAARGGHLPCLRYAHENGCPSDARTVRVAEREGHTACAEYARRHGCPDGP